MGLNNKQVARHILFNYLTLLHNILIMLLSLYMAAHKEQFLSKPTPSSPKWRNRPRKQWLLHTPFGTQVIGYNGGNWWSWVSQYYTAIMVKPEIRPKANSRIQTPKDRHMLSHPLDRMVKSLSGITSSEF